MSDAKHDAEQAKADCDDVVGKFLARSYAALQLADGADREALETRISVTMLGAQAHALQNSLDIAPYSIILALRELADIGEQKLIERGEWPAS